MARRPGIDILELLEDPIAHASKEARWGTVRAVVKVEDTDSPRIVANELVCARLAAVLGLPVPAGEVGKVEGGRRAWVSTQVGPDYAPPEPELIVAAEPHLAAGCAVFDVWIGNHDRSDDNLLYSTSHGLWLIDHEQALAGQEPDAILTCTRTASTPLRFHAFRSLTLDGAAVAHWVNRIRYSPTMSVVDEILKDGRHRGLYTVPVEQAYKRFLRDRRDALPALVAESFTVDNEDKTRKEELPWPGGSS